MQIKREEAVMKLLDSYRAFYNIYPAAEAEHKAELSAPPSFVARCDYFEQEESYAFFRRANLWTTKCEEFIYLFSVQRLTAELWQQCLEFAHTDGMARANIGSGHMYTYITPVVICDSCAPEARQALERCSIHKTFLLSFHGWMDVHAAAFVADTQEIYTNKSGRCVSKVLSQVLFPKNKK